MFLLYYDYICKVIYSTHNNYIRIRQELTYEIENPDIKDEFTIKF